MFKPSQLIFAAGATLSLWGFNPQCRAKTIDWSRIANLETSLAKAYESNVDLDSLLLAEMALEQLKQEYKRHNRLQELIWTEFRYGDPAKAKFLEKELRFRLSTELIQPDSIEVLDPTKPSTKRVMLESGLLAIFREGRNTVHQKDRSWEDILFYELDSVLEFHLVPITVTKELNGIFGTLRVEFPDVKKWPHDLRLSPYPDNRLHILDYITEFIDRNPGNLFELPGGHLVAHDNDIIYGSRHFEFLSAGNRSGKFTARQKPKSISALERIALIRLQSALKYRPTDFHFRDHDQYQRILSHVDELINVDCRKSLLVN